MLSTILLDLALQGPLPACTTLRAGSGSVGTPVNSLPSRPETHSGANHRQALLAFLSVKAAKLTAMAALHML
jgi:hypothetical protein